jgi:diguanylate cyclase (GGDEF)-like protein
MRPLRIEAAVATGTRPSLWRPSVFAATWQVSTWLGCGLVAFAVWQLSPAAWLAMGLPMAMITVVVLLSELRPIVMTRLPGNPVSISLAFVFATMFVWGLYPALVLQAAAVVLSEIVARKPVWKVLFNVGQYSISVTAAWLVMRWAGVAPTPSSPHLDLTAGDFGWIVASWVVYHLVNLALVAGLAEDDGQSWWESFAEEFWFFTGAAFAVLALSPLVAAIAVARPYSWTLLPLLLLPLIAVQRTAEMSRAREHEALHDPLTGLPNRMLLADRIEHGLAREARSGGPLVLVFLDLDMFKVVNDGLGHAAGDALLIEVAHRLASVVRAGDTLARFGGDEFAILFEDVPDGEVGDLATRVTSCMVEPFHFQGREVTVTASIGVARSSGDATALSMLRDADAAMHRAKAAGRDRVVHFHTDMHRQDTARLDTEAELRLALDRGELRTHYQPVVDVQTETIIGVEALVRWQHPRRGLLLPGEFIPLAEETGLIVPLGLWILDHALTQAQRVRDNYPEAANLWVAVNLSARQLQAPGLVDQVERALEEAGIPPALVHLEITESVVMDSLDTTLETLKGLRSLGVHLAVDDFGTGYSSLSYLKELPVSTLKIDRAFINDLGNPDSGDLPIVEAITTLARALHLNVIAEGVETREQLQALRTLRVPAAQGYYWSRPKPARDLTGWMPTMTRARRVERPLRSA